MCLDVQGRHPIDIKNYSCWPEYLGLHNSFIYHCKLINLYSSVYFSLFCTFKFDRLRLIGPSHPWHVEGRSLDLTVWGLTDAGVLSSCRFCLLSHLYWFLYFHSVFNGLGNCRTIGICFIRLRTDHSCMLAFLSPPVLAREVTYSLQCERMALCRAFFLVMSINSIHSDSFYDE